MIFRSTACVQHLCKECHTSATTDMRVSLYSWCTFTFDGDTLEQSYFPSFWSKNKNDAVVLTSWRVLQSNQSWPIKGKSSREMRTLNCTCVNTRSFNITEIVLICLVSFATPALPYLAGIKSKLLNLCPHRNVFQHRHSAQTHLQHYFIDSSSIRLKVERLVVMIAEISEFKYCMTCKGKTCFIRPKWYNKLVQQPFWADCRIGAGDETIWMSPRMSVWFGLLVHLSLISLTPKKLKCINNPVSYLNWPDQYARSLTDFWDKELSVPLIFE